MNVREMIFFLVRYSLLVFLALFNLALIYFIFTPLTVWPSFLILKIIDPASSLLYESATIFFQGNYIALINACIAGAAYYLLCVLNFTTPMDWKKRSVSLALTLGAFLVLNIIRIAIFSLLYVHGYPYFDQAHMFVWYFGSTILIVGIWFAAVFLLKIEEIPIYSDVMNLVHDIRR